MPAELRSNYAKQPISLDEQLVRLEILGIGVGDANATRLFLTHTSYYRVKGYLLAFRDLQSPGKPVREGTSFQDVVDLMEFDRELRNLTLAAIDVLEVSIRTVFNEIMAARYNDAFWYQDSFLFDDRKVYGRFLSKCASSFTASKELFVAHYAKTYGKPPLPPGWMLIEVCSLGIWSRLFANLKNSEDKAAIAAAFGLNKKVLQSWLRSLSDLRNLCAHHCRIWNRKFGVKPSIPRKYCRDVERESDSPFWASPDRYAVMALMIGDLLSVVRPDNEWKTRFCRLMERLPSFRHFHMGFAEGWRDVGFWQ